MKKMLRTLFAVLALTLCLCLPAFAQEAKPAQPAAKEDKTVTDLTGRDAFLRDVKGFTTNFGGPYVFEQASRKSPPTSTVLPRQRVPWPCCVSTPCRMTRAMPPSTPAAMLLCR